MQSRRDSRPQSAVAGGQQLPEMHVSMKVNIVSDGPGGISFTQAVNTPGNYNGGYDFPRMPIDQNQYALTYPDSSMLQWPADGLKQDQTPTEPVVQMPTDTSQENILDNTSNVAAPVVPVAKPSDKEGDKKKHRHHRHKHREKKEGDEQSMTRSQSASSMTTSVKVSDITAEKKHRRPKHKSGDESSSASRRSNGERSSSARPSSHRRRPEPAERRSITGNSKPLNGMPANGIQSTRNPEPVMIVEGRKLDELLSEVVINTFADDEIGRDGRLISPKMGLSIGVQESSESYRSTNRVSLEEDNGTYIRTTETIAGQRFMSQKGPQDRMRYPVPVDTPVAPKVTISQAVQADVPFHSDRGIQTDKEDKKKREKKPKTPTELTEAAPVHDYLRHIAEATAGLIEASRVALEHRAQTPQIFSDPQLEFEKAPTPIPLLQTQQQQVRVPKETLIDDPAIAPLSPDPKYEYDRRDRLSSGLDTSQDRRGRITPGLDSSQERRGPVLDRPLLDASFERRGRITPGTEGAPSQLHASKGIGSNGESVGNRSFDHSPQQFQPHHHHSHQYVEQPDQQGHDQGTGVYYMHTYCAICGSPRTTRKAVSGDTVSPTQEYLHSTAGAPSQEHFLVIARPNGGDEIRQASPSGRPSQAPPAPPPLPPIYQQKPSNGEKEALTIKEYREENIAVSPDYRDNTEDTQPVKFTNGNFPRRIKLETYPDEAQARISDYKRPSSATDSDPPQPLPKDYMDHNRAKISKPNGNEADPRLFTLANFEQEDSPYEREDNTQQEASRLKKPGLDITAEARARLREMQLISCDTSPRVQIGRPLKMFSPDSSVVTVSTETSVDQSIRSDIPQQSLVKEAIIISTNRVLGDKVPNGQAVVDRSLSSTHNMDFKEALEQRRQQLAKQRETFFGPFQPRLVDDTELRASYERNSVFVSPVDEQKTKLNVLMTSENSSGGLENKYKRNGTQAKTLMEKELAQYGEMVETAVSEEITTVQLERTDFGAAEYEDLNQSRESGHSVKDYPAQQSYAEFVAQKRLVPSAKIFQLHTKPSSSVSSGSVSDFGKRQSDVVPGLDPSNMSVTSGDSEMSFSRRALAGSGGRTLDDGISSVGSIPRSVPYGGDTGSEKLSDYGQERYTPTPTMQQEDDGTLSKESVASMTSYRAEQTRLYYGGDTLSSSGSSAQAQKRAYDLYRKALMSQQQGRKEIPSRASSINSERSSVSGALRDHGGGAFTAAEVERYLDENASDYGQDRLTPLDEDWPIGSRASETGTRSHDSLASETSYKADASHEFYSVAYSDREQRSPGGTSNRPSHQIQPVLIPEKSFADIMRERSAARNARLLYYSTFGQQPPSLDRIEEQEHEGSISKGRPSSTVTTESDRTMTATDSIDREGSGIYAVRPSAGKVQSSAKKSALLTSAMLGRDDAGSSSWVGSELENIDDYSQGRISPMMDIGNDRAGTISSYGTLTMDSIRMAELISREPRSELGELGFVGYGKGAERVLAQNRRETDSDSSATTQGKSPSSEGHVERKRFRQTDL